MLEDNRVGARLSELWSAASRELKWVIDLPFGVYVRMAEISGQCCPKWLRDTVIKGAHVSYHFIWRRVLHPATLYPWALCRGDIDANLAELKELEEPEEPCTNHIWNLLQLGEVPLPQLRKVVQLLAECPWSSMPAEQQHASVALLHRWHQEYGLTQLLSRAMLHQTVRLLPTSSKLDKQLSRLCQKMQKLERAVPERASGSHMLVKALVSVVSTRKEYDSTFLCFGFSV